MKKWLLLSLMLFSGLANAAIELGKDYTMLATPQPVADPKKVEVIEFFSYHCIHCLDLEPAMSAWEKSKPADVSFTKEQIVWQKSMEGFVRMFAAFKSSGTYDKLHRPAFEAVVKSRVNLSDEAVFNGWLKQQPGVNVANVMQAYKSFGVNAQVARATKMTRTMRFRARPPSSSTASMW